MQKETWPAPPIKGTGMIYIGIKETPWERVAQAVHWIFKGGKFSNDFLFVQGVAGALLAFPPFGNGWGGSRFLRGAAKVSFPFFLSSKSWRAVRATGRWAKLLCKTHRI